MHYLKYNNITTPHNDNSFNRIRVNLFDTMPNSEIDKFCLTDKNKIILSTITLTSIDNSTINFLTSISSYISPSTILIYKGNFSYKYIKNLLEILNVYKITNLQVEARFISQVEDNIKLLNKNITLILYGELDNRNITTSIQVKNLIYLKSSDETKINYLVNNINAQKYLFFTEENNLDNIENHIKNTFNNKYIKILKYGMEIDELNIDFLPCQYITNINLDFKDLRKIYSSNILFLIKSYLNG